MNYRLRLLYYFNFISVFTSSLIVPYFAIFVGKLDKSLQTVGILQALQILSLVITSAFLSKQQDQKVNKAHLVAYGWMLGGISWFALAGTETLYLAAFAMLLNGLGNGLTNSTWNSLVAEHLDNKQHLKEYSFWTITSQSLIAAAGLLAPFIISQFGFSGLLWFIGTLQFIAGVGLLLRYPQD